LRGCLAGRSAGRLLFHAIYVVWIIQSGRGGGCFRGGGAGGTGGDGCCASGGGCDGAVWSAEPVHAATRATSGHTQCRPAVCTFSAVGASRAPSCRFAVGATPTSGARASVRVYAIIARPPARAVLPNTIINVVCACCTIPSCSAFARVLVYLILAHPVPTILSNTIINVVRACCTIPSCSAFARERVVSIGANSVT